MKTNQKYILSGIGAIFGSYLIGHEIPYDPQKIIGFIIMVVGFAFMGYYYAIDEKQ